MLERTIKMVAACSFIIGIAVLGWVMLSGNSAPENPVGDQQEGSRITITGSVVRVDGTNKVYFIRLSPAPRYPVVSFDPVDLSMGDKVRITGRVKRYKGKLEVVAEKIIKETSR